VRFARKPHLFDAFLSDMAPLPTDFDEDGDTCIQKIVKQGSSLKGKGINFAATISGCTGSGF